MEFRILGPLEAREGETLLPLGGARQRAILALLLTRANEVVSRDRLIDDLWGAEPPQSAANVVQTYVWHLRKVLPPGMLETRPTGYVLQLQPDQLDLHRFEGLIEEARRALAGGRAEEAARLSRAALQLWRGPALADFAYEPFAQAAIARLEELRLTALERRIEAELALGRHVELVAELEALTREHPLRERLRGHLMLALYRSGRQAEALATYQDTRRTLVEELGIDPGPALQELERAILRQEPALEAAGSATPTPARTVPADLEGSILVLPRDEASILPLVSIAAPLARQPPRDLIIARLLEEGEEPAAATRRLAELREELAGLRLQVRIAAYTSSARGNDAVLLAREQDVDLVLLDAPPSLLEDGVPDADLAAVLRDVPSDVAVLVAGAPLQQAHAAPVVVPFGGAEHDWSAVELGAWSARALQTRLQLIGTSADRFRRQRDASRLLARASLVVQAAVGIVCEPVLVRAGAEGVLEAATTASLVVIGLSNRWQVEGLGTVRLEVARASGVPTLFVRRGLRPGGLAPRESMTRFTWSLEASKR